MENKDDLYYIRLVQKGNIDAFVHIVRRYNKMIFTIIRKVVNRREEAEDVTQEVFIKVFQNLSKFKQEAEFSTWIYRIAYNTAISELRKKKNRRLAFEDNYDNIADENIPDLLDNQDKETQLGYLEKILNNMPEEDALLITLFYMNNSSINQISEISGYSVANVKVKLHRIRKYMHQEMNKMTLDDE